MGIKNIPVIIDDIPGLTPADKEQLSIDDNQLTMAGLVITAIYNNSTTKDIPYGYSINRCTYKI